MTVNRHDIRLEPNFQQGKIIILFHVIRNNICCMWFVNFRFVGKDGKIAVFQLADFEGEINENLIRGRAECKEHKIDKTKGN